MEAVENMSTEKNIGYVIGALTINIVLWVFIFSIVKALV
jgi:hypothetical protein